MGYLQALGDALNKKHSYVILEFSVEEEKL